MWQFDRTPETVMQNFINGVEEELRYLTQRRKQRNLARVSWVVIQIHHPSQITMQFDSTSDIIDEKRF